MEQINSKQDLINYFEKGCKKENQLSIGVEHEKFIFDNLTNQRANFEAISKVFNFLKQFGWKPIIEKAKSHLSDDMRTLELKNWIGYLKKLK